MVIQERNAILKFLSEILNVAFQSADLAPFVEDQSLDFGELAVDGLVDRCLLFGVL